MLYLRRGLAPDSGGAGRHRGGLSVLGVYKPHKLASTLLAHRRPSGKFPDAVGSYGGFPGSRTGSELIRNTDVTGAFAAGHIPEFDELAGETAAPGSVPQAAMLEPNDVVRANPPAGAGWGDPLDRLAEAIQEDLDAGAISRGSATGVYGCILDGNGRIDGAATEANRRRLRGERKPWPRKSVTAPPAADSAAQSDGRLARDRPRDSKTWTRCTCGFVFAPAAEPWREYAARHVVEADPVVTGVTIHESMELREYACPGCGRLHAVDICRKSDPDPHDIRLAM